MKALLALEDGRTFPCRSFTGNGEAFGEIVFNTGMSGYQEVLTDPSYKGQIVTMTYPLIGNYGVNPHDIESAGIQVSAFIIKENQPFPSNFRSTATLSQYLMDQKIMGIEDLDTRALTRHIRNKGAMRAFISSVDLDHESLVTRANKIPSMVGQDLAKVVSTEKPYRWQNGNPCFFEAKDKVFTPSVWVKKGEKPSIVAMDLGIKYNIVRCLETAGFEVIVVPAQTNAESILSMAPDGVFLSNGPGDPEPVAYAIDTVKQLVHKKPIFGICLGHQILGLALNGRTYKLKFGHRGANQPVKNLETGKVEITSQNHGFAVDADSLDASKVQVTHINLNDNTVEGLRHLEQPVFSVQYHPEASPGPHDASYLFDQFKRMIDNA